MPRRRAKTGSLGKRARLWRARSLHGNHSVDTAITSSSRQIQDDKKRCVLLCAGWIIKYTPSVANSLLPPPHSGAFHLLPSDFGGRNVAHNFSLNAFLNCEMSFDVRSPYPS